MLNLAHSGVRAANPHARSSRGRLGEQALPILFKNYVWSAKINGVYFCRSRRQNTIDLENQ